MYLPFLGVSKMKKVIATLLFFIMIIAIQIPTLGEILWHDESRSNINGSVAKSQKGH